MDSHKKSMIRKWVENQTSQVVRTSSSSLGMQITRTNQPLHCQPPSTSYKEQSSFKTSENSSNDLPPEDVSDLFRFIELDSYFIKIRFYLVLLFKLSVFIYILVFLIYFHRRMVFFSIFQKHSRHIIY